MKSHTIFKMWRACLSPTAVLALLALSIPLTVSAAPPVLEVIHEFVPAPLRSGGGLNPGAGLVQGPNGTFYGTTSRGGKYDKGTVYLTRPNGETKIVHSFRGSDGANPTTELSVGPNGLYGSTQGIVGSGNQKDSVLFKIDGTGRFTLLHSFNPTTEGSRPGTLVLASDGNFYSTLQKGANNVYDKSGALFRMTPAGQVTILHLFKPDGWTNPSGILIQGLDGALYGTIGSYYPPPVGSPDTRGAVYRYDLDGTFTVLHAFPDATRLVDGDGPMGLVQTPDGALYGLTNTGGTNNSGTMYTINPDGTGFSTITQLPSRYVASTAAQLILASDGNFYGLEDIYYFYGAGRYFQLTPAGVYTLLYDFPKDFSKGYALPGRLLQAADGHIYGTAREGGSADAGTLFRTTAPVGTQAH